MRGISIRFAPMGALVLAVLAPGVAAAEDKDCPTFQACLARAQVQRWTQFAQVIESSASNFTAVRRALERARSAGDTEQVKRLEQLLQRAQADWEAKKRLAETLRGKDYRGFLLARAAHLEERLQQAELDLKQKTDQFRRLNEALQKQNRTEVDAMTRAAKDEAEVSQRLLWAGILGGLEGAIVRAQRLAAAVPPVDPADPPRPRPVFDWAGLVPVSQRLKRIDVAKEAWEGYYWAAAGKLGQVTLEVLNEAGRIGPIQTTLVQVRAVASIVEVGTGLVALAQVHGDFEAAQARQQQVLDLQRHYQFEIYRLGEVIKLARAERDRGREAIARQSVFEQQVDVILRKTDP